MSAPVISVLMSAYNVEKYVGEAIESILSQTYKDFEFIIIDDASMDGTFSIINQYKDNRIRVLQNEKNLGLAASLNKGLHIVEGKYMARMDADDISHIQRLEKQHNFLEQRPDIDICGTSMQLFGVEDGVSGQDLTEDADIKAGLVWKSTVQHGTVMVRMETIFKNNLFYDESIRAGQDWKYWYSVKDYVRFASLKDPLYFYRRGDQNITIRFRSTSQKRAAAMYKIIFDDINQIL